MSRLLYSSSMGRKSDYLVVLWQLMALDEALLRGATLKDLASMLKLSTRQVRRYLKALEEVGMRVDEVSRDAWSREKVWKTTGEPLFGLTQRQLVWRRREREMELERARDREQGQEPPATPPPDGHEAAVLPRLPPKPPHSVQEVDFGE
jgi:hypothetical protein